MASVSEIYAGEFLNVETAINQKLFRKTLSITGEEVVVFNEDDPDKEERKIVLDFEETKFRLVLNKTNAGILAKKYGDESGHWVGHHIQLMKVPTRVGDSIQVDDLYDENEDEGLVSKGEASPPSSPEPRDNQENYDSVETVKETDDPHTANPEDDPTARKYISMISKA